MREILAPAAEALGAGSPIALATVWSASGSSPRETGATMLVLPDGRAFGNVSAGCVDGHVHSLCTDALDGAPTMIERFGIADDDAIAVGLACGGSIEVLVRAVTPGSADAAAIALLARKDSEVIATSARLRRDGRLLLDSAGCGGEGGAGGNGVADGGGASDSGPGDGSGVGDAAPDGLLIEVGAAPRLVIVGAVEVAVSLSALAASMGFRVVVVDPRDVFANPARFPGAEVVVDQPGRYLAGGLAATDAVCVLTHDPKFDVPALRAALTSPAGFVGAMGSRRTHEDRVRRLAEAGVAPASLARLRSPIGLDLRGRAPQEIALSILAEIIAVRHGGSGRPLSELEGPVHAPAAASPATRDAEPRRCAEMRTESAESALAPAHILASGPESV